MNKYAIAIIIKQKVAEHFGVTVAEIDSHSHDAKASHARHVARYFVKELTPLSNMEIACLIQFGHRTAVHRSWKLITGFCEVNTKFRLEMLMLRATMTKIILSDKTKI